MKDFTNENEPRCRNRYIHGKRGRKVCKQTLREGGDTVGIELMYRKEIKYNNRLLGAFIHQTEKCSTKRLSRQGMPIS